MAWLRAGILAGLLCALGQPSFGAEPLVSIDEEPQVGFSTSIWTPGEGSVMGMQVILTSTSDVTVTVDYVTQAATDSRYSAAEAGSDYVHAEGTLTITPGETAQTFQVTILDDSVYEGLEQFIVRLSNSQGAPMLDSFETANVYIQDSERVPGVDMLSVTEVESAGELAFPVILGGAIQDSVTMSYSTSNGTAIAGEDYTASTGTLSFGSGETRKTIHVAVTDDAREEPSAETFNVHLSQSYRPLNESVGDLKATGTILDDDGNPTLAIDDAVATETAEALSFVVTLGGRAATAVTVNYATSDVTATSGVDYEGKTGSLTFAVGDTSKTITVTLMDDDMDEPRETFSVSLSGELGASLVGSRVGTGTILDDDDEPRLTIHGSESGEDGHLDFVVSLLPASGRIVTVGFLTDDEFDQFPPPALRLADAESDFVHQQGSLTFAPGEMSKTIRVVLRDDALREPAEAVVVTLVNRSNATFQQRTGSARCPWSGCDLDACCDCGVIVDNDATGLSIHDASVAENAGPLDFLVELDKSTDKPVWMSYSTSNGSAAAGDDYQRSTGTLTIAAGERRGTIRVEIIDDRLDERDETLGMTLSSAMNAMLNDDHASGTIRDDDPPPTLAVANATGPETAANLHFPVSLSEPSSFNVTVAFATADATAVAGEDYEAVSGTLTFAAGESARTVSVPLVDDALQEPGETFRLELTSPVNATVGAGVATGTVTDDDPAAKAPTKGLVLLFEPAANPDRQGFVRVINHSAVAGEVLVEAIDDAGMRLGPVPLAIGAGQAKHFNSDDLEAGNADKGLPDGVGPPGEGAWRLELSSRLDIEVLSYARTSDGFVTSLHDTAPATAGVHRAVFLNPGENVNQVSRLRLINPDTEDARVTITGTDDVGVSSMEVAVAVPAGTAREWTAAELESGMGTEGGLGDGDGKWRLRLKSDRPVVVLSLIESPTGNLTNLSTLPRTPGRTEGSHAVPLFPSASDAAGRQGFVRVVNRSDKATEAKIEAFDDADWEYEPLTLSVGADEVASFNSDDLELGNDAKGLSGSTGAGDGDWRLELESEEDIAVLSYVRTSDGFLTSMHDIVPETEGRHRVVFFNPASNVNQVSVLRLVNPGDEDARATIAGVDDDGVSPGTAVVVTVAAGASRELKSAELESGESEMIDGGALGDGVGKWRLRVSSDRPIWVMSLLENPTGHLTNLSTATDRTEP